MDNATKITRLLAARAHPSFGVSLNPLFTLSADDSPSVPPLPVPALAGVMPTGRLPTSAVELLFAIASYPAQKWAVPADVNALDWEEFAGFVQLKTQQAPSYFTVYQQVVALYNELAGNLGPAAAMEALYTPEAPLPDPTWPAVRHWVIQEFLYLFIVSGNFRYYGWKNYPGWMGGPYNDPTNLPYRSLYDAS